MAYKLKAVEGSAFTNATEDQYFSGLWLQRTNGKPTRVFKAVDCQSLYGKYDVSKMFWQQIEGYLCPAMNDATISLQNESPANLNGSYSDFFFIVDTCSNFANITKRTDCKSEQESQAMIDNMYVSTKIQTQYWNTKVFLRNGWHMESQWQTN